MAFSAENERALAQLTARESARIRAESSPDDSGLPRMTKSRILRAYLSFSIPTVAPPFAFISSQLIN
jgi:hypothetical protein